MSYGSGKCSSSGSGWSFGRWLAIEAETVVGVADEVPIAESYLKVNQPAAGFFIVVGYELCSAFSLTSELKLLDRESSIPSVGWFHQPIRTHVPTLGREISDFPP